MKWIERLTVCLDYVEENLTGEIDMKILADKACLSRLYFFRLFEAVTGQTLSDYIRRRRMTLAARELGKGRKVIDVALDYGYSSPEAFSRAFKTVHACSPSSVKDRAIPLKSFPRLIFNISIKGDEEMNYRIEKKEAFKVIGRAITTTAEEGKNFKEIPLFWKKLYESGDSDRLAALGKDGEKYGICFESEDKKETFRYAAAALYRGGDREGFEVMDIPEADWAVFDCVGPMPQAIGKVWHRVFAEWLPATGYELEKKPQIEFYYPGDSQSDNYRSEVWIPVKK